MVCSNCEKKLSKVMIFIVLLLLFGQGSFFWGGGESDGDKYVMLPPLLVSIYTTFS